MEPSISRGKRMAIVIICTVLALSVLSVILSTLRTGARDLLPGLTSLALTVLLVFFLYKGFGWAKWVMGILMILGALIGIFNALSSLGNLLGALILFAVSALFGTGGCMLLSSRSIAEFMRSQRNKGEVKL